MATELWRPSPERARASLLAEFMEKVGVGLSGGTPDYDALWQYSIDDTAGFWRALWDFAGIIGTPGDVTFQPGAHLTKARFFPDARLNFAENLLKTRGDSPAIIWHGEGGARQQISWDELHALVSRLQQALRAEGIKPGDRVAGYLPNMPGAVAAMLAVTSLGAVWSSSSPDFGINGVYDRFGQIEPKVLFCAEGYDYNGKNFSSLEIAGELAGRIPSIQRIVVMPHLDTDADISPAGDKAVRLADFIAPFDAAEPEYTRVGFRDPLYIMFSSGTTGLPKCIIHTVGGTLLQHLKEHLLQTDEKPGDRLFYFTTCGWMMWNWQVSALAAGVTLVQYDGSPFYPDGNRLADIAAAENVTHFGTSAKYLDACSKAGIKPRETHDLGALRTILSTGSPLVPEGFDYVYRDWKNDVCLSSIAGGTDIIACFVGGSPVSPVWRGQCQKRMLGMNVQVFDENGNSLQGRPGELVCTNAHPSMPSGFWNDPDGSRYHAAYFERFENVWCHGDWVTLTEQGGMIFHGRSDATLNPGGVRIGTAEIYRQVERIDEVLESLVIGQQWEGDVRVILFVRLREGVDLSDDLVRRIRAEIRKNASPRHVPARIIAVADIPRTKSGKITELAVRDIVHGRPVKNKEALANPEALELFRDLPELHT